MTFRQTVDYLYSSLPMFQRVGDVAVKKDLTNIRLLCEMLGEPQVDFPSIHIAGTNGKGSTSHMLAAIFQAAGWKVGLYTSPHYVDFRERIRVDGQMIPKSEVIRFVEKYKEQWAAIGPSFFEMTVAMAFDFFRKKKVDIAIIETGLGGRLDSTNVIMPMLSVITNIGFDHMSMLGHTLPAIAFEKAGIIKPGIPAVIGEWHIETAPVFKKKASDERAPLHFASRHIRVNHVATSVGKQQFSIALQNTIWFERLTTDLVGPYQLQNIRTVLETIYCWNRYYPDLEINQAAIRKGVGNVVKLTGLMGRWMVLQKKPLVITDAAHNAHGMQAMLPSLLSIPAKTRRFVLGFVSDKDVKKILGMFPADGKYYWCSPNIPRGKSVKELIDEADSIGLSGKGFISVQKAYKQALKDASSADLIFVGGSSYVVGEFLAKIKKPVSG